MSYISNDQIEEWLGTAALIELTDDEGLGSINTDRVDEARLGAEAEADSYLATRYRVPVALGGEASVASVLRAFVLDLAIYRLHGRKPPAPADVVRRHDEAVTWLSRVAAGIVQLPSAALLPANTATGIVAATSGPERGMTRERLADL